MIIHNLDQRTPEWYQIRTGKPTGSAFSKVLTSKGELSKQSASYAASLAIEIYTGEPNETFEGTEWTDRGKELEAEAQAFYELDYDVDVQPVGFVTDDQDRWGCSPDGLVRDDGMTEYKCLKPENHIEAMMFYRRNGRCEAKYVPQTQGQMWVCERKWCDLVFYCPKLPTLVIRQEPDPTFFDALEPALLELLKQRDERVQVLREYDGTAKEAA